MVDRAALEMPCPERDPGFESLALRHRSALLFEENEGAFLLFSHSNFCNIGCSMSINVLAYKNSDCKPAVMIPGRFRTDDRTYADIILYYIELQ